MNVWHDFPGPNVAYILDLYDRYRKDPNSVDPETRAYFAQWPPDGAAEIPPSAPSLAIRGHNGGSAGEAVAPRPAPGAVAPVEPAPPAAAHAPALNVQSVAAVTRLARAIRAYGHLAARLDPLGSDPRGDPDLELQTYGLTEADMERLPASLVGGPCAEQADNAREAIDALRQVYCSTIGYDYDHIHDPEERSWLREAAESFRYAPPKDPIEPVTLLKRLTEVEVFEQFLHRVFPGRTRFSIEGLDILVPVLDQVVAAAGEISICMIFIGMGHRGRLNVLAHVLNRPYAQILAEFKDPVMGHNFAIRDDLGWTGDVIYHKGASRPVAEGETVQLVIAMPPNPSHLEFIDPVVSGMARAASTRMDQPGAPRYSPLAALPIMIHGDASFTGQGIVAETLNLSSVPGYRAGGTLHIITNNQLGFTTAPDRERGTTYSSDLAKGFDIPIVHVNADDVAACVQVARLAFAYRARFNRDFLIDLVGYRRWGHNEGDEPSFTQPLMYQRIEAHPSVRKIWAETLVAQGIVAAGEPDEMIRQQFNHLQGVLDRLKAEEEVAEPHIVPPPRGTAGRVKTAVPAEHLRELNETLLKLPEGFTPNPKLNRAMNRRRAAMDQNDQAAIDWGTAEQLALATILEDGTPIRFTGQDTERGTFSQRHAVFHDVKTGATYMPLQNLPSARAGVLVNNSPLSENAALGFEYGYSIQAPRRLVLWEAQYGDFINGAQGMVDEFIVSGRAKWEQTPSLVLLLPHGYEGQGPDHSSARIERFLQAAAEINLRLCYPTTAAQYFHLLRRQAALLESDPLPLVVLTPKSLLRHPLAASPLRDFAECTWQPIIDDKRAREHPDQIRRLILCSGKVYVDLVSSERRQNSTEIAIARVEQLYVFPTDELRTVLNGYPNLEMVIWVQEEPENMGAWTYVRPLLATLLAGRYPLHFVGRPPSSSPAEGSTALHAVNQKGLVEQAYNLESDIEQREIVWVRKE